MRHCHGETVEVYEVTGESLPALLRNAAEQVEANEGGYATLTVHYSLDEGYEVTLYQHY